MHQHLIASCTIILALTGSVSAVELTIDYIPRLSLGFTSGLGTTKSEINHQFKTVDETVKYEVMPGENIELPMMVAVRGEGPLYFIAAPAFVYSRNTNKLTIQTIFSKTVIEDTFTQLGGKFYMGAGWDMTTGWHGELLPYIGLSSVKVESTLSSNDYFNKTSITTSSSERGTFTIYGITLGGYYTPKSAKRLDVGARVGYAGASGKIDGINCDQNGGLVAFEIGWHL